MFELEELKQLPENIQPFIVGNNMFDIYLGFSIIALFLYAIVVATFKSKMYHKFSYMFSAEQETYKYYLTLPKEKRIQTIFLYLFSSIQIAYLIPLTITNNTLLNFSIKCFIVFLFLFIKEIIYKSLKQLLKNNINIGYFLFNYQNIIFYTSLATFFTIVLINNFEIIHHNKTAIFIIGVIICYIFLVMRIFMIARRFKFIRSIYFFLYLCALEIIPILIGIKIVDIL